MEVTDRLDCEIAKIRDHFHNGPLSPLRDFIKAYRDSELGVHAHFNVGESAKRGYCVTAFAVDAEKRPPEEHSRPPSLMRQNGIASEQQSVLVDDVQLMEDVERVVLAKSVIRLQFLDQCLAPFDYAIYSSARFARIITGNGNDRKLILFSGLIAGFQNQLFNQVVEARSQLMDDLSASNADIDAVLSNLAAGIILMRDDICFALERLDKRIEILDLLVGPLNLDPNFILGASSKRTQEDV